MIQQIKSRSDGRVLFSCEAETMLAALQQAVKSGANLDGADLRGANLRGADLRGADLRGANLRGANLDGANLFGANLYGANLDGADLYGADLRGAKINWQSHDLVAEILQRAAGNDIAKRKIAGLILISRNWCWKDFFAVDDPLREWALSELRKWARNGDNAPEALRAAGENQKQEAR